MERKLIKDLDKHIGESVKICGHIEVIRNHNKLLFLTLRDYTSKIQCITKEEGVISSSKGINPESAVILSGKPKKRPENAIKDELNGSIEFEIQSIEILSASQELPFDRDAELNIDTELDYRPLSLRRDKERSIFITQANIVKYFREFLIDNQFVEFQSPKLVGGDAEGGAGVFPVDYFKHKAYLATSPQLYKQMLVPVYERVFSIGNVYRAEKHSTTRHVNEYTSLDIELGFIKDHTDVMDITEKIFRHINKRVEEELSAQMKLFGSELPKLPKESFPRITLLEAQEKIAEYKNKPISDDEDLSPEDERDICEYAKEMLNSDFIFITNYPTAKRPVYAHPQEDNPKYTKSFDLLFRGVEILTGGQRIHKYDDLVSAFKKKGLNPDTFEFYLQAFKYGCPPHGGFGCGLERLTAKYLNLANIKEAIMFPRDLNRIDKRLK